ncbi:MULTISPECIES: YfjI family protein [Pseudomonas]|jgi:hypothetical protein|uniref:DUF3987 domain-containing protein n=2 Tax=Pseudomonas TaxID=286 RepID=A0A5C5QER9_9PSED|nr:MULTISPECIES: YfjI family protein [Pseudomonas]MDD0973202.1 YfjI family protein [Pseudomonas fontis]MDD0989666.1 YfjI family protein [Pseudomonas fontis]TWS03810.1 DUF3987 domain-containing protein [Pseudomonas extremaustralis]SDG24542.1 Protein of unknown function [Pseudomonas extremaustralis]
MFESKGKGLPPINSKFPASLQFPLLNSAIDEVERNIQSPRPLIFFGALTAISVAAQGRFDVRKPIGQCVPLSLLMLAIASSGERKSSSENVFLEPVREFQKTQDVVWRAQLGEWEVRDKIWLAKNKELLKRVEKASSRGECTELVEQELIANALVRPVRPRQCKMIYEDSTSEALFCGLYQNIPTAGIISSEGGLKGRAFNDLSKQNAMWSGDPVVVDRKTAESYELHGARLTVSFMTQPSAFKSYIDSHGEKSRGSGLWARFLVCFPESTQGTRVLSGATISWDHINNYAGRLKELLSYNLGLLHSPNQKRKIISFAPAACERWLQVFNDIESEIREGGRFYAAGDHASKLADNIARVAALLHVFEGFDSDISIETLNFAIDFCLWCSDEFYRLFVPPREIDLDVYELRAWFDKYREDGFENVRKNSILQYGPRRLRSKIRLDAALDELISLGEISYSEQGSTLVVDFSRRGYLF